MVETPANSLHPLSRAQWRRWLQRHHARLEGVWVVRFKKHTGKRCLEYEDAVEEALCFGWIDGKIRPIDDERTMVWFAPRKPRSTWSRSNKERAQRLIETGRMAPAGLARIELAKRNGSWDSLAEVEAMRMPPDLTRALRASATARRHFNAFSLSAWRGFLYWITSAKRAETRARRVAEAVRMAERNERLGMTPRGAGRSTERIGGGH
jgi:uncharacterized protein YdeI (YjbR/CyaY-like superfamily)